MAHPRRQSNEPVKIVNIRLPWTLYQQISDSQSVNARIIELLKIALEKEGEGK